MNKDTPTLREVEELEAWFRAQCHDAAAPDVGAVRAAVRCALDEQWLRSRLSDDPPPTLSIDIKNRLRAELEREGSTPRRAELHGKRAGNRSRRVALLRWSVGISAAAAALALWLAWPTTLPMQLETAAVTAAYASYAKDDLDMALIELGADIALLEHGWGGGTARAASDEWYEKWIDRVDQIGDQL